MLLFLDFESRYDSAAGYTLKKMSCVEYVRSPLFKAFGLSACTADGPVSWVPDCTIPAFLSIFKPEDVTVVAHNAKFDGFILEEVYGFRPKSYICTQAMARAVLGKTVPSHSLAKLAEHFQLPAKGIMRTDGLNELTAAQEMELAEYGKHDTWLCRELFNRLNPEFPASQLPMLSWTVEAFCRPKLTLDVPMLRKAAADEIRAKRKRFRSLGIDGKEFRSQPKFKALLESKGYAVPMKPSPKKLDENGKPLLIPALALQDEGFVEMLESEDEQLRTLCEARKLAKSSIIQTRSKKLAMIGATGLFPADIQFSGAEQTHRMSGGDGSGGNFQNFVKKSPLRLATRAMDDHMLVVGDAAQIEARFVAYLSGDPLLLDIIENKPDLYLDFGTRFYEREITKRDAEERAFAKEAILGLGYNMGWEKFQNRVKIKTGKIITEEEAKRAVDLYRSTYRSVPALWRKLNDWIIHLTDGSSGQFAGLPLKYGKEYIELPSGLKMRYPNLRQVDGERKDRYGNIQKEWVYDVYKKNKLEHRRLYGGKLLENICQALAGEHIKTASWDFMDVMTATIHDEVHLIVPTALARLYVRKLQAAMETPPTWMPNMVLKAEVAYGESWGGAK